MEDKLGIYYRVSFRDMAGTFTDVDQATGLKLMESHAAHHNGHTVTEVAPDGTERRLPRVVAFKDINGSMWQVALYDIVAIQRSDPAFREAWHRREGEMDALEGHLERVHKRTGWE